MNFSTDPLPSGWSVASLGDVTADDVDQSGPTKGDAFVYVDIGSIDNETKRITSPKSLPIDQAPSRARQNLKAGDVLVSMTRPNLNAVAMLPADLDGAVGSTGFHVLRAVGVKPSWLFHTVQSRNFVDAMSTVVQGALYPAVRPKDVRSYALPIPPLDEQSRLTDSLDELLSDLDAGVSALERVRAKLKLYRASVLKAAVDGTLTVEWRAKHRNVEPSSELLERILSERCRRWEKNQLAKFKAKGQEPPENWKKKYREPAALDASKLPELPNEWCWASVDQIGDVGTGATPNRAMKARYYDGGSIPWITSSSANSPFVSEAPEFVTPKAIEECNLTLYPPGTLLIAMYGEGKTRGKCTELQISTTTNQALAAIQSHAEVKKYLKVFFAKNYQDVRRVASGGVQPNLNLSMVREITFPLPPLAEQEAIVEAAEDQISIIDHLESDLDAKLSASQGLRQAILQHAFSGKLVPQDSKDEPALELLKRIAAEREERERQTTKARQPAKRKAKAK